MKEVVKQPTTIQQVQLPDLPKNRLKPQEELTLPAMTLPGSGHSSLDFKLLNPTITVEGSLPQQTDKEQEFLEKLTKLNLAQFNASSLQEHGTDTIPNTAVLRAISEHLQAAEQIAQSHLALELQKRHAHTVVQKLSKVAPRALLPRDKQRLAAARAMLELKAPYAQATVVRAGGSSISFNDA